MAAHAMDIVCAIAVSMTGLVNAVNMADGQNGIAIGMFVVWSICLMATTNGLVQGLALVLLVACPIALVFNMLGRVFLGDAGAYGVTFIFGILAIVAHNTGAVSAETLAVWFFIPVVDCLRLMVSRVWRGHAPSNGDRNHFHHRLQEIFGTRYSCIVYLAAVGSSSITTALLPRLSLVCLVLLGTFYAILTTPVSAKMRRTVRELQWGRQTLAPLKSLTNRNVLLFETSAERRPRR